MSRAFAVVVGLLGIPIAAYGIAMFLDYRGTATRYWRSVSSWHSGHSNAWRLGRPPPPIGRRPRFARFFGAAAVTLIGVGWLFGGIFAALTAR